jgi:rRNA maturation protein Nop10
MTKMNNKLKNCPICGSSRIGFEKFEKQDFKGIYTLNVVCCDCGLSGFKNFFDTTPDEKAEEVVINYWNNRVPITKE